MPADMTPIDRATARAIVRQHLDAAELRGAPRCVLVGDARDFGQWWVQGYQSEAFVVRGDVLQALAGNGPYFVPKDGSAVFTLTAAEPVEPQMARLQRREDDGR